MTVPQMVLVVWEDIKTLHSNETWTETKKHDYTPFLVRQVGFLLEDAPTHVLITQAWNPELTSPPDQIPRGCIREVHALSPKQTRQRSDHARTDQD